MISNERRKYEQANMIRRKYFERLFMRKVYNQLHDFNKGVADILLQRGVEAARTSVSKVVMQPGIGDVIKDIYLTVGLSYARTIYAQVRRSAREPKKKNARPVRRFKLIPLSGTPGGQINFNERWTIDILQYFRMFLIDKAVVPITLESKELIQAIFDKGIAEGWTIERMAKELTTDRLLMYRARLIVRTETAKAAFYGRRLGAADSGFETIKEWISARDTRTRHSHRDMDGETMDYTGVYNVPIYRRKVLVGYEKLKGPGDPDASAENVCNCRCTEAYQAKRDSNGRIIRKPVSRISVLQPGTFNNPVSTTLI